MAKPVILTRDDHAISRKNIDPDALKVMRRLREHDYTAYLVGGGVRDLLLGIQPKDFDIGTDAHPNQIKKLFRNCFLIGRRFRLAHIRFGPDKVIETSTFRRPPEPGELEAKPAGRKGHFHVRDNTFGTPAEDALRRDFTVNGLFYDPADFTVIDHVGGLRDLKRKSLRSIGDPDDRFREDPVRMVRAVRFASRLGFRIESRAARAIRRHHTEITKASPARMLEEIHKLFGFGAGEAAFRLLYETGLLGDILPEVAAHVKAVRNRRDDPLWRCLAALDSGEHWTAGSPPPTLLWATLLAAPLERAHAARLRSDGDGLTWPVFVTDWLEPLMRRQQMPRQLQHHLITVFCDQERMTWIDPEQAGGRRLPVRHFVQHAAFDLSLALLEIRAAAGLAPPALVKRWRELRREQSEPAAAPSGQPAARSRRRRGGRRRRGRGAAPRDPAA